MRGLEELDELLANAFGADCTDPVRRGLDGGKGLGLDLKIELGGQPHGAEQPQMVLGEPVARSADGADQPGLQIRFASHPIVQRLPDGIVEQTVDGEIAAKRIGPGIAEGYFPRTASVLVVAFGAKSSDLKLMAAFQDHQHPELASDRDGALEYLFDLFRQGRGGDIVIDRSAAEQEITNAPADPEGGETGRLQAAHDPRSQVA